MITIQQLHAYHHLIQDGDEEEIVCPRCQAEMLPWVDKNDMPCLRCFFCTVEKQIGLAMERKILKSLGL